MRKFRPAFILAVPLLAAMLFSACGSTSGTGVAAGCKPVDNINTSNLNLVVPGTLTVASDITYPPQEYQGANKAYTGADIDIANEIAKRLCLSSSIQNVQFDTIIAGITASTPGNQYYDMSISAWTITADRQKQVDMIPYFIAGESLLVQKGNPKHITKLSDLCGLSVSVESGTVEEGDIQGIKGETSPGLNESGGACASNKVKLLSYDTQDQAIQALLTNNVDAAYQDSPVSSYYATKNPGQVDLAGTIIAPSPEGIVVRKDNAAFESAIKTVLGDMMTDGTYTTILQKYQLQQGAYKP